MELDKANIMFVSPQPLVMMSPTEKDLFLPSIIMEPVSWWGFCLSNKAFLTES